MAVIPAPRHLDDSDGTEQMEVDLAGVLHADPRLNSDTGTCFLYHLVQSLHASLLQLSGQYLSPPALNDPSTEGSLQQCASHQGASPPGLDLSAGFQYCLRWRLSMWLLWGVR